MSRRFYQETIISRLVLKNYFKFMTDKINRKNLTVNNLKDFEKSNLDILTEENDRLLKSLKRPAGSYRAS